MKKAKFLVSHFDAGVEKFKAGQAYPLTEETGLCIARGAAEEVDVEDEPAAPTRSDLDAALAALPGNQKDPEYVVGSMRRFFGDLFTDDDEATVRDLVKAPEKKPSEGLKVDELKAALTAKGIAIPDGAKKEDLAKLLDDAAAAA